MRKSEMREVKVVYCDCCDTEIKGNFCSTLYRGLRHIDYCDDCRILIQNHKPIPIKYVENDEFKNDRVKSIEWFAMLSFEEKYFAIVRWLSSKNENTSDRTPDSLTGREIQEIFKIIHSKTE